GESVIAWHVTIAPSWFDPSSAPAQITPFGILYALHDSAVRPLYGGKVGPGLAEAWSESPDGLTYEFRLRRGLKFHNGDPVTAEDVKFSFDRYNGAGSKELKSHVEAVEIVNPLTVRIRLNAPSPDFMTVHGTTVTGAGPGAQPPGDQRGVVPRLLSTDEHHHPARDGLRAPDAGGPLRSPEGEAAPRGGRVSQRHRRRRFRADPALHHDGGSGHELSWR